MVMLLSELVWPILSAGVRVAPYNSRALLIRPQAAYLYLAATFGSICGFVN
jgi:hypothetical protein